MYRNILVHLWNAAIVNNAFIMNLHKIGTVTLTDMMDVISVTVKPFIV